MLRHEKLPNDIPTYLRGLAKAKQTCKYFIEEREAGAKWLHIWAYFVMDFSTCFSFLDCCCIRSLALALKTTPRREQKAWHKYSVTYLCFQYDKFLAERRIWMLKSVSPRRFEFSRAANDAGGLEEVEKIEIVYRFGISHDFCYFLKCSNLFNYHNILCAQPPANRSRNLFLCFA
jgi:hypothetical protein